MTDKEKLKEDKIKLSIRLNKIKEIKMISMPDLSKDIGIDYKTLKRATNPEDLSPIRFITLRKIHEYMNKNEGNDNGIKNI